MGNPRKLHAGLWLGNLRSMVDFHGFSYVKLPEGILLIGDYEKHKMAFGYHVGKTLDRLLSWGRMGISSQKLWWAGVDL